MSFYDNIPLRGSSNDKFIEAAAKRRADDEQKQSRPAPKSPFKPVSAGTRHLDPKLANLKAASDASRKNPGTEIRARIEEFKTFILQYLATTEAGARLWSEHLCRQANVTSLCNGFAEAVLEQGYTPSIELAGRVHGELDKYAYLFYNRHVGPDGSMVLREGEKQPTVYQYVSRDEQLAEMTRVFSAQTSGYKKLPLADLKKLVVKDRKHPKAGEPGYGGIL